MKQKSGFKFRDSDQWQTSERCVTGCLLPDHNEWSKICNLPLHPIRQWSSVSRSPLCTEEKHNISYFLFGVSEHLFVTELKVHWWKTSWYRDFKLEWVIQEKYSLYFSLSGHGIWWSATIINHFYAESLTPPLKDWCFYVMASVMSNYATSWLFEGGSEVLKYAVFMYLYYGSLSHCFHHSFLPKIFSHFL